MQNAIPSKEVRKIIFDILIERSNAIDAECDKMIERDMSEIGCTTEYTFETGWTACGTRILADDILEGILSLEESVEVLTKDEKKEARARCQKWLEEQSKNKIENHI